MEYIIGIQRDMRQMSTNIHMETADLKNLLPNMSANKRVRKQRKHKDTEAASTSSSEQGG
jgi:hypothetical protein